jgi:hypothetical protein
VVLRELVFSKKLRVTGTVPRFVGAVRIDMSPPGPPFVRRQSSTFFVARRIRFTRRGRGVGVIPAAEPKSGDRPGHAHVAAKLGGGSTAGKRPLLAFTVRIRDTRKVPTCGRTVETRRVLCALLEVNGRSISPRSSRWRRGTVPSVAVRLPDTAEAWWCEWAYSAYGSAFLSPALF